jgi:hypothetical protein
MKPFKFEVGDWILVDSKIFDGKTPGSYSNSNPKRQIGEVTRVWASKNIVQVMWSDKTKSLHKAEQLKMEKRKVNAAMMVTVMIFEALKKELDPNDKSLWPKDFFAALVQPEWREWVAAVKKEIESW